MAEKDFLWAGDVTFNDMIDILQKQTKENERRGLFSQPPLPYEINVNIFVEEAAKKAREAHANAVYYGQNTFGDAETWANKAKMRFRDSLLRMADLEQDASLKSGLWRQIYDLWPELRPPRDLSVDEMTELCELQQQADTLLDNLKQTIQTGVDGLWEIAMAEKKIISGTSASGIDLIRRRTQCRIAVLKATIWALWNNKSSVLAEPVEQIERNYMHAAPRRWIEE